MFRHFILIVTLFIAFSSVAEEQQPVNGWAGIGMPIPPLEGNSDEPETVRAYRALSSWTNLPKEDLEKRLLDYSVVRVRKPDSNETKFVEVKEILDGKFRNYDAIMPRAYADATELSNQHAPNYTSDLQTASTSTKDLDQQVTNEWSSDLVIHLGYMTIGFACFMLVVSLFMGKSGMSTNSILRISGLILVVTSAVFLVIIGYSQEQISPVIGLLGAIAGYLLGSNRTEKSVG